MPDITIPPYMGLLLFLLYHTALVLSENKQNTVPLFGLVFLKFIPPAVHKIIAKEE